MKNLLLLAFILLHYNSVAQSEEKDKKEILNALKNQRIAWSKNDLEGYMHTYWNSDSLKIYGSNGITEGWEDNLEKFRRNYPNPDHTGTLSYKINDVSKINESHYYVLGEYHLKRNAGNADGFFMMLFRKIDNDWKIILNTSY